MARTSLQITASSTGIANIVTNPNMGGGPNLITRSLFSTNTPNVAYGTWYTPGFGSPAVSTSDYYHMGGIYQPQPYDLNAMGADGAAVSAAHGGMRYVWMLCGDHPQHGYPDGWPGTTHFFVGFSNDPQVWPDPSTVYQLRVENKTDNFTDSLGQTQNNFLVYHYPRLVYNPDSAGDKFWIYAEGTSASSSRQHELGLFTTPDFSPNSTTSLGPIIPTSTFGGWTSLGFITRLGVNSWQAITFGKADGSNGPGGAVTPTYYKYTSTNGQTWTADYTTVLFGLGAAGIQIDVGPYTTISGQKYMLTREETTPFSYVSLLSVDNTTLVSNNTWTRISLAYQSQTTGKPGPTYLQNVSGYEEDGILTIFALRGFFTSGTVGVLNHGPYLGITPNYFNITASISSNVMTVTAVDAGSTLATNQQLYFLSGQPSITSQLTGSPGGTGTYNVSATSNIGSSTILVSANGGLWQEFIDMYYYVTDASAAVNAAPLGVTCDCVNNVVTVSWNDCLPNRTYRVYRGSSAGTQTSLVGNVTGTSITDTPTPDQQWWYKVVTMNAGTEKQSRVVHCYVSNNSSMVNRHINRVIDDGGDQTKINMTFLASVDSYLTSNNYHRYLKYWVDVRFGVKLDGSGFISKVYCLGSTRMPRGGDYTPTTSNTWPSTSSNTSYSATSFRGTTPSWVNNAASAHGYFGNGRTTPFQRKNEITLIAAYQKPGTAQATLFGHGQFAGAMYLDHASGSSGNITFSLPDGDGTISSSLAATVAFSSATNPHVVAAVHNASTMTVYLDGTPGTPVDSSAYNNPNMTGLSYLRGLFGGGAVQNILASGGGVTQAIQTAATMAYSIESHAQFTCACLIVFEKGMSSTDITTIGAMYA